MHRIPVLGGALNHPRRRQPFWGRGVATPDRVAFRYLATVGTILSRARAMLPLLKTLATLLHHVGPHATKYCSALQHSCTRCAQTCYPYPGTVCAPPEIGSRRDTFAAESHGPSPPITLAALAQC
eukprot:scaffold14984_cov69-Phaeocystis_antarctica.AAC.8